MADVFISYVEEDRALALSLSDGLEAAGFTIWCYERHSVPGPSYLIQTGQAIEECRAFLVVLSRDSLGSSQIDKEVVRAHETGKPFIPVLSGIAHAEFQARRPEWRQAIGGATSIPVPAEGVHGILPRIVRGLQMLRIEPAPTPGGERMTPAAPAARVSVPPHVEHQGMSARTSREEKAPEGSQRPPIPWWQSGRNVGLAAAAVLVLIVFGAAGVMFFQRQSGFPPTRGADEPPDPGAGPAQPPSATKTTPPAAAPAPAAPAAPATLPPVAARRSKDDGAETPAQAAWEPTRPIEFVVPAGTGGGADQMARLIAGIAEKHKLSPRLLIVVNKSGGAGAEGFLYVKDKKGDPNTIIVTLSNLFMTPMHTGVPFSWRDLTPIARLALDRFILWVNAETPYKTAKEYIAVTKERPGGNTRMKMGGTGFAQEDQIITVQLEQGLGVKFTYVPFKGGGEVCVNLVGKHVDSTVNNPIECVSHWKGGRVRPLAVFDPERIPDPDWKDIPTVKEALGVDIQYQMLRGVFGPPDMPKEAVDWYVSFLRKVYDTPEFRDYLNKGALKGAFSTGSEYVKWLEGADQLHRGLMAKGGLLKK